MSACIYLVVGVILLAIYFVLRSVKRPPNFPPGPKWLPLFGNSYELKNLAQVYGGQHIVFEKWEDEYDTPILGLKLGSDYVVVALTYPLVKEIHTRDEFTGRPDTFFLRLRTMGTRQGITCTDGQLWSEHRSFATRHLRQVGYGGPLMEKEIQTELVNLLSNVAENGERPIWPGSFLSRSVINVLWTMVAGKPIPKNDKRLDKLLNLLLERSKLFDMCGGMLTQMPWIRFILPEKSGYNLIKNFNATLHEFFMETINEHKATFTEAKSSSDFIYAFINEMNNRTGADKNTFTDTQLTMTILDMFIAGAQTTSTTLDLGLMMMVVRPDLQKKVIEEIQSVTHEGSKVSMQDKHKLPFTEAFLMEIQRYFHIVPLSGPRRTLTKTHLGGYTLPKNTVILMGLRRVHMDKMYWKDPESFRPDRFLSDDLKIINHEYFMPFGQGKRRCLGDSLARACLFLFFVGILQQYEPILPSEAKLPSTKLLPGIILTPQPYQIVFRKR